MRFIRWFLFYTILMFVSCFVFLMYLLGTVYYLTNHEENTCEMTYMFEYPQYVRIMMDNNIENKFSRYSLHAYGEGVMIKRIRKMKFTGIPVLFVPGNAGSHEQVRSLASVSLRKSLNDRTRFHFDYFTVSLGKDYSALNGGVLIDEAIYVSHCIKKIISLYNEKYNNIVIIGHSMGSIVAKAAISMIKKENSISANILIALASPHKPAVIFDKKFADFYDNIENVSSNVTKSGTTIISIGGGHKDILVSPAQTIDRYAHINTLSTSIPAVWISTDHLCILWCKQLVFVIIRALFDCVDTSNQIPTIPNNPTRNMGIFSYHLINVRNYLKYAGKKFLQYNDKITFEGNSVWLETVETKFSWRGASHSDIPKDVEIFLMIPLSHIADTLTIDTYKLKTNNWLFACSASNIQVYSRRCNWGWNLTNKTRQIADINYDTRKSVDLNLIEIQKLEVSHIAIKMEGEDRNDVIINIDVYNNNSRITEFPNTFDTNIISYLPWIKSSTLVNIEIGILRKYVNFKNVPDAVSLELKNIECQQRDADNKRISVLVESVESWNPTITQFLFFTKSDKGPKVIQVQQAMSQSNNSVQFRITSNPTCQYSFEIKRANIIDRMSTLVRDRWPILYQIAIALLLLTISLKIDSDRITTVGISVFVAYAGMKIHVECLVMVFVLHLMAFAICCSVVFFGSVVHKFASRFLARAITFSVTWSEWLLGDLSQFPICLTVIILSILPASCGALAMILTVFTNFLKLTQMYEDYLEELLMNSLRYFKILKPKNNEIRENTRVKILNNLIIFMLICFAAIPAIPSVLVWAKNLSVNSKLESEDPVLLYSWIVIIICSMMDFAQIPTVITFRTQILGVILFVISLIVLYLSSIQTITYHQWWMPPIVAVTLSLISLNSIIP